MKVLLKITLFMLILGLPVMVNTKIYGETTALLNKVEVENIGDLTERNVIPQTTNDILNGIDVESIGESAEGKVILKGTSTIEKVKIRIKHNQTAKYQDLYIREGKFEETVWLLDGIGTYELTILVNLKENSYISGPKFSVYNSLEANAINTSGMFLNPEKDIESDSQQISMLAQEITKNSITDIEKAHALYIWVSHNIQYDYNKFSSHQNNVYDFEYGAMATLGSRKGVCYDMAALYAALARSLSLETKLVKGQGISSSYTGYHAWNEIYSKDEERWIKLDVTFASGGKNNFFDSKDFNFSHIKYEEL